ncbi:hypothetical protein EON65_29255 [archaeon]|nr:MAG: hypothetical protein EON65_29255 [archaeon]
MLTSSMMCNASSTVSASFNCSKISVEMEVSSDSFRYFRLTECLWSAFTCAFVSLAASFLDSDPVVARATLVSMLFDISHKLFDTNPRPAHVPTTEYTAKANMQHSNTCPWKCILSN